MTRIARPSSGERANPFGKGVEKASENGIKRKKKQAPIGACLFFGSGKRIRTSTYGVRVRCATITQYRYVEFASGIIQCRGHNVKPFLHKNRFLRREKMLRMQAPCGRRKPPPRNHIKTTGGRGTPPLQTVTLLRAEEVALVFKHQQHTDCRRQQEQQADDCKSRILHARLIFGEQRL